jgi:hypothetical protein
LTQNYENAMENTPEVFGSVPPPAAPPAFPTVLRY